MRPTVHLKRAPSLSWKRIIFSAHCASAPLLKKAIYLHIEPLFLLEGLVLAHEPLLRPCDRHPQSYCAMKSIELVIAGGRFGSDLTPDVPAVEETRARRKWFARQRGQHESSNRYTRGDIVNKSWKIDSVKVGLVNIQGIKGGGPVGGGD